MVVARSSSSCTSRRRRAGKPSCWSAPCSVTGATRNAGPNMYSSPMSATLGSFGKIHEQGAHERRASLIGVVAERIDVRHQLVTQLQIFLQDRLRLLAIRPHLVVLAAAVGAQDRQERSILEPARVELGIVIVSADIVARVGRIEQRRVCGMMLAGQILPAADVLASNKPCRMR